MATTPQQRGGIVSYADTTAYDLVYKAVLGSALPAEGAKIDTEVYDTIGALASGSFSWNENIEEGDAQSIYGGIEWTRARSTRSPDMTFSVVEFGNAKTLELAYHPSDISVTGDNIRVTGTNKEPAHCVLSFEGEIYNDGITRSMIRLTFPDASFRSRGAVEFDGENISSFEVTWGANAVNGEYYYFDFWTETFGA